VEWNIGESAGLLAAFCIKEGLEPAQIYGSSGYIEQFQNLLSEQQVEIEWPSSEALRF
jgi:hypothetical protein